MESRSGWSRVIQIYSHSERKMQFTWENTRNLGGWYSSHFPLKNTTISSGLARETCKFTVEMKPRRILHEKTQRFFRGRREWHVNLQSTWKPGAFYTRKHNDFSAVGGGGRRGCILIRNRDGGRASRVCRTVSQENTRGHGQKCCGCHENWTAPQSHSAAPATWNGPRIRFWPPRVGFWPSPKCHACQVFGMLAFGFLKGDLTLRVWFWPSGRVRFRPPAPLALWDALKLWDALALFKDRACLHSPCNGISSIKSKKLRFGCQMGCSQHTCSM